MLHVLEHGIRYVIIGSLDPNPRVRLQGFLSLVKAGVKVFWFPQALKPELENKNHQFISQYRDNQAREGSAEFDPTKNNGFYTIGSGNYSFTTEWHVSDTDEIYACRTDKVTIGSAKSVDFADITDAAPFLEVESVITLRANELLILRNSNGIYAAIKLTKVEFDGEDGAQAHRCLFTYRILDQNATSFRG